MKFESNTSPISAGLDLVIITSNITKFYQKSCIVELTLVPEGLRINTEVSSIKSEILFKGKVSGEGENHLFVDSLLFKNLIKSLTSDIVEFEFNPDGLVIYSGKSKFNLPQVVAGSDLELSRPNLSEDMASYYDINKPGWEFIQTTQMYAIAMSFIHPVYTNVWVGESGDVIVGDFDNGVFTHSNKSSLPTTCLLTDTIINLFNVVPENSKIKKIGKNYEIQVVTDPYSYLCEFSPKYEDDPGVGSYSSSVILNLFEKSKEPVTVDVSVLSKYISQAELFTTSADSKIDLIVTSDSFSLLNENVDCKIPITYSGQAFRIPFKLNLLKDALSHMDSNTVNIIPLLQDGEASGIVIWTENVEVVLAGVDQ